VRLESVQNAVDQAACVAKSIVGRPAPYTAAPWFWSDQFDIHLQMAGLSPITDQTVIRGDPDSGKFSVFYYREGMLQAINSINRPAEHLTARKLIAARANVTPDQAEDEDFDLKGCLPGPLT
jgi:3-phenylpropionate/trans-cinnamate dioxygenase ferredoxin reductase subunit